MQLLIAANWKMHKTAGEAGDFCRALRQAEDQLQGAEVLVCPPFTALVAAGEALRGSTVIKLGAQNLFWEDQGAFTGEISPVMLVDLGVEYVIIGHSERRHIMGESDDMVRRKLVAALRHGLKPILCVGETEQERRSGRTAEVLKRQLHGALEGLDQGEAGDLVVAYEPVWAIGTGIAASAADAAEAAELIHEEVQTLLGPPAAGRLRVQYGGSVNDQNIGEFVSLPAIHGALVGGASLKVDTFIALVRAAKEAATA